MTRDFVIDRRAAGELLSTLLERAVGDKLVSVPGLRAVIVKWSTPSALRTADVARVQRVIVKRSGRSAPRNSLTPFWAAPAAQTVTVVAEATWGETNGDLAADPASYQFPPRPAQGRHRSGRSWSIPQNKYSTQRAGSDPAPGTRTLAEIGDPNRFANSGRLAAYAGTSPRRLTHTPYQHRPKTTRRKPPRRKRHVRRRVRRYPTRPRRSCLLPAQTSRGQRPLRRGHLRRPPPLQHQPGHAQDPNPLPTPPTPTRKPRPQRLDNKTVPPGPGPDYGSPTHRSCASGG